jgi:hypothetical protein
MKLALASALLLTLSAPAFAEGFQRIEGRDSFLSAVQNRDLTRMGISVKVTDGGEIIGSAFGRKVTGDWNWQNGYFCRDLYWGGSKLDLNNCQTVEKRGNTLRFTSDKGNGDSANLRLR